VSAVIKERLVAHPVTKVWHTHFCVLKEAELSQWNYNHGGVYWQTLEAGISDNVF